MDPPALAFREVSHRFRALQALAGVDLEVEPGDIYGFLGLNGAGKTTAIRLALGLLRLRQGEIAIFGAPVGRGRPEVLRRVGVLFEDFAAHSYLGGFEHLRLHARLHGLPRQDARRAAAVWLERVGLAARGRDKVQTYSLGMRRRLGVACALVMAPRLVILDEPTNGLDPQGISDLRGLILDLNEKEGITFFLSSHILGEVEQLCRRVGILHQGRMAVQGAVRELTGKSGNRRRLRVRPAAKAALLLRGVPGCRGIETGEAAGAEGEDRAPGGRLGTIHVEVEEEDVPLVVRALVEGGVDVHEVAAAAESLESVFHRAVSRAGGPAAKEAASAA